MASQERPPFNTILEITPNVAMITAINLNVEMRSLKTRDLLPPLQLVKVDNQKIHLMNCHYSVPKEKATFENPLIIRKVNTTMLSAVVLNAF